MKTLKLDHELAELVTSGIKTSTWRIFDDKDLSVGDVIELIDKVNPSDRTTWKRVGIARIHRVVEKPISDITQPDFDGHEPFESPDILLATYRKYYGPDVTFRNLGKDDSF